MIHGYNTLPDSRVARHHRFQPFRAVFTRRTHCGKMASRFSGGRTLRIKALNRLFVTVQLLLSVLRCSGEQCGAPWQVRELRLIANFPRDGVVQPENSIRTSHKQTDVVRDL